MIENHVELGRHKIDVHLQKNQWYQLNFVHSQSHDQIHDLNVTHRKTLMQRRRFS